MNKLSARQVMTGPGQVRLGAAGLGAAWRSMDWLAGIGTAWRGHARAGGDRLGAAGKAGHGAVRLRMARQGTARRGVVRIVKAGMAARGLVRHDGGWIGWAGMDTRGWVGQGHAWFVGAGEDRSGRARPVGVLRGSGTAGGAASGMSARGAVRRWCGQARLARYGLAPQCMDRPGVRRQRRQQKAEMTEIISANFHRSARTRYGNSETVN